MALFALLNQDNEIEQLAAMDALGLLRETSAVTSLTERYHFYRDGNKRALAGGALEALARIGDPSTIEIVKQLAGDQWAEGKDATALAVAFARERLLKDGSIAADPAGARRQVAAQPGARLPRRARRARAVILPVDFYRRPTLDVARDLIGKVLVYKAKAGNDRRRDRRGRGLHRRGRSRLSRRGRAAPTRNAPLYGPPGRAYVYLNYGLHDMMNAVTEEEGHPAGRADPRARAARGTAADAPSSIAGAVAKGQAAGVRSRAVSRARATSVARWASRWPTTCAR